MWKSIEEEHPEHGERCLVWVGNEGRAIFATWDRYRQWFGGGRTGILKAMWWQPEPEAPPREVTIHDHA